MIASVFHRFHVDGVITFSMNVLIRWKIKYLFCSKQTYHLVVLFSIM